MSGGNGSLNGFEFKNGVLPSSAVTSTGGVSVNYNSKMGGGKRRKAQSNSRRRSASYSRSMKSLKPSSTLRLYGVKKSRKGKSRKMKKGCFW